MALGRRFVNQVGCALFLLNAHDDGCSHYFQEILNLHIFAKFWLPKLRKYYSSLYWKGKHHKHLPSTHINIRSLQNYKTSFVVSICLCAWKPNVYEVFLFNIMLNLHNIGNFTWKWTIAHLFNSCEWLRQNFSFEYQYNIKHTWWENIEKRQSRDH